MNIVFFGSDTFAVSSLQALAQSGNKILCVVTQPDKKKGRGLHLEFTPVKTAAGKLGLQLYQPSSVNTPEAAGFLKKLDADLFVVVAYGQILSRQVLDIPKIFCINAHASLLPKYRGAAPANWALIRGEEASGVTIIKINEKLDSGPILLQRRLKISEEDNVITLEKKLSELAASLLLDSLKNIENKSYKLVNQDEAGVSFAPKLKKDDGLIDWEKSALEISDLVRGCFGWPGAFTYYKGKVLKVYKAACLPCARQAGGECGSLTAGKIIDVAKKGIVVATAEGFLVIQELQMEAGRRMGIEEFLAGHRITVGELLAGKK